MKKYTEKQIKAYLKRDGENNTPKRRWEARPDCYIKRPPTPAKAYADLLNTLEEFPIEIVDFEDGTAIIRYKQGQLKIGYSNYPESIQRLLMHILKPHESLV